MKTFTLTISLCLLVQLAAFSQEFENYGNVSSDEFALKQCSFDKDANAIVLIHEAVSNYDDEHHLVTYHHVRIKVLNERGFAAANISIPFYRSNDFEQITSVEGMTINAQDGQPAEKIVIGKKSIFTDNVNENFGEVKFTFPAIHAGSIIDYKYASNMKNYGGLDDWDFQERLPVLLSKYTLIVLPNVQFSYRVDKLPEIPIVIKQLNSAGGVYFEMRNIPSLGDEAYMDSRKDYLQKVIFQLSGYTIGGDNKRKYMTSWSEVNRELNTTREFGSQVGKSVPGTEDFIKQVKTMVSGEEKMEAVFKYVRSNMVWNRIHSKYSLDGVKEAWRKKKGNSGDINLLLVNLLKEASLEAYPMLVSDRFHGKVNTDYPFIEQFNSVVACVIIGGKRYYLDATESYSTSSLIPVNILNTTAFIINRKAGELIVVTTDTMQFKEYIDAKLNLAANGAISGNVLIKSFDYARIKKVEDYKADKSNFITKYLPVDEALIVAKSFELRNLDNDSLPLEQAFELSGNLDTGRISYLTLNYFAGFNTNPFQTENRFSDINFGYKRFTRLDIQVQLPPGSGIDEMPGSVRVSNSEKDILFTRQLAYDKATNTIQGTVILEFKKSMYDKEMYPVIKEIYQKIFAYLKEEAVIKRK
jgi:hypothetical protein